MEYTQWAPHYERIRQEFGFPADREEAAAVLLERLLPASARTDPLGRIRTRVKGRDAIVVGLAPDSGPPPLWRRPATDRPPALLAADGATAACLAAGFVPTVVVTDLDGPVPSEITANGRGSLVVVHGHGDNLRALAEWIPQFPGEVVGSWSGPPRGPLLNVGGFTDGDRAAFLAEHCGAARILLWGFDFERVDEPDPVERARKLAKLAVARRLLSVLAEQSPTPVLTWQKDGPLEPYVGGKSDPSTR